MVSWTIKVWCTHNIGCSLIWNKVSKKHLNVIKVAKSKMCNQLSINFKLMVGMFSQKNYTLHSFLYVETYKYWHESILDMVCKLRFKAL